MQKKWKIIFFFPSELINNICVLCFINTALDFSPSLQTVTFLFSQGCQTSCVNIHACYYLRSKCQIMMEELVKQLLHSSTQKIICL